MERHQNPQRASIERADDEKTVRDEQPLEQDLDHTKQKDLEAGKPPSSVVPVSDHGHEETAVAPQDDGFPDGGLKAWSVVAGSAFGCFATFGFVNAWGVFQAYYESTLLSDTPPSTIAWIGSIQYALVFIPGLIVGQLFDMGIYKIPIFLASVMLVVCTILVAQCTEYWQFLLCQGIAVGLSCGVIFGPTLGAVSHWFKRRKGLALGFVAVGSSGGGTVFPIAARNLILRVGFPWTMRILAFILLAALIVTNLTIERRLPPKPYSGSFINLSAFKSAAYSIYCAAGFATFLGLYTLLTYVDVSAVYVGVDEDFSFYLIAIANASSALGRIVAGILADKFGALNIMIPSTAVAGVMTYVWPFVPNKGGYIGIAIVYGIASGVFVSLLAAPLIEMGDRQTIGIRLGMYFTIVALGALAGPPISGAINTATGGYKAVGYYAGSAVMLSIVLMIVTRSCIIGRRLWGKI